MKKSFELKFDMEMIKTIVAILLVTFLGVYLMEEVWCEEMSGLIYAVGSWGIIKYYIGKNSIEKAIQVMEERLDNM